MSRPDEEPKDLTDPTANFAPFDLTDGRKPGFWQSRYNDEVAKRAISWERNYLLIVFCSSIVLPVLIITLLGLYECQINIDIYNVKKYILAWAGGTLGGTMFSAKWLYHSVAKHNWNIDRQMWRILTPHLSAALALVFIVLINSEMLTITSPENLTIHKCYGIGFLVGYFSDNAIGKLTELAQVFFGSSMGQKK